jgi:hypothetical protein
VTFRSSASILAVCGYCRTTLLNRNGQIENLGKMADLAEDASPLRIEAEGHYQKKRFVIVGRIQLKYEQGLWNEWCLLFDDRRTGWLSEAGGEYMLSFLKSVSAPLPGFAELKPGDGLTFDNADWTVGNLERAECVAGEGELPFKVGGGYPAPVADLRSGARMATLDYSEGDRPLVFIGESVAFASLKWRNLREDAPLPTGPKLPTRALRCAQCGAPLNLAHEGILAVGCAQCGGVTDAETQALISRLNKGRRISPLIPLGKTGQFRGEKLEAIGFMQRFMTADGQRYYWREYLLARVGKPGYRWLTEYDGHWNVADVLNDAPASLNKAIHTASTGTMRYRGQAFRHFQSYAATVEYVVGEFTWRVSAGERSNLKDYVAPPLMLSYESTNKEINWSLAEYVPPEEIKTAFGLRTLPEPIGVYANQVSPWRARNRVAWRGFLGFAALALLLQLAFALFSPFSRPVYVQEGFTLQASEEPRLSAPFALARQTNLRVESKASGLNNSWVELNLSLINEQSGEARHGDLELSYYSGVDSDGRWSEDKTKHDLVFRDVPPGTWRLMLEHVADPKLANQPRPGYAGIPVSLSVRKSGGSWINLGALLLALALWPLFALWRNLAFEIRRWAESDHPITS